MGATSLQGGGGRGVDSPEQEVGQALWSLPIDFAMSIHPVSSK